MAFGDGPDDAALQSAWTAFCAQLQHAGEQVFKDANATSGAQRVDAFRFLTQNLGQAYYRSDRILTGSNASPRK